MNTSEIQDILNPINWFSFVVVVVFFCYTSQPAQSNGFFKSQTVSTQNEAFHIRRINIKQILTTNDNKPGLKRNNIDQEWNALGYFNIKMFCVQQTDLHYKDKNFSRFHYRLIFKMGNRVWSVQSSYIRAAILYRYPVLAWKCVSLAVWYDPRPYEPRMSHEDMACCWLVSSLG